jgi:HEAT repeat protein
MATGPRPFRLFILLLLVGGAITYYLAYRPKSSAAYIAKLKDPDATTRHQASDALVQVGAPAVPQLIDSLQDEAVRPLAIDILHQIGPDAIEAVSALSHFVDQGKGSHRAAVIAALGAIGSPESISVLSEALEDDAPAVRAKAVVALGRIDPVDDTVVAALTRVIADSAVRLSVIATLGQIGPQAEDAVPTLIEALQASNDAAASERIAWALGQIGPDAEQAVPTLIDAMGGDDYLVRARAAAALGNIGPQAKEAVPALIEAVKSTPGNPDGGFRGQDWAFARNATAALGKIGPDARDAVAALTDALEHGDEDVREYAGISLRQIDPAWTAAVE